MNVADRLAPRVLQENIHLEVISNPEPRRQRTAQQEIIGAQGLAHAWTGPRVPDFGFGPTESSVLTLADLIAGNRMNAFRSSRGQ